MNKEKTIQLHLDGVMLEMFEESFKMSGFKTRTEFIRSLVVDFFVNTSKKNIEKKNDGI